MTPPPRDELTSTVFDALQNLVPTQKATFLLDTALALIAVGQYGAQVENYFDVYLRTPNLPVEDVVRALVARGKARKAEGECLLAKAQQDYEAVLKLDPSNKDIQHLLGRSKMVPKFISNTPASQRAPPEIWERIAYHIPRYHLRTWLFLSPFHREIAVRIIFHTLDLYFGEDQDNLNKGLDIFDRAKNDPVFARRVKSLRLHWAYEEGDMLDLMMRIFRTALPEFKALQDFEWIGYPELRADTIQDILQSHSGLHGLGLIGWHFDAIGISSFTSLRKFTLRAEDDDGFAPMSEIPLLLNTNLPTLKHLVLAAYLARPHSWDMAFQSHAISRLTHLDLVDTRISHYVLGRILGAAGGLRSLTLHGTMEEPAKAAVLFGGDQVIPGPNGEDQHTFLPHLESFRRTRTLYQRYRVFAPKAASQTAGFGKLPMAHGISSSTRNTFTFASTSFGAIASFSSGFNSQREPTLKTIGIPGLRTLGVRMGTMTETKVLELVTVLPREMVAISLWAGVPDRSMNAYAPLFTRFHQLSFLHLQSSSQRRPKPNLMPESEFQRETDLWQASARGIACTLPTLDFVGIIDNGLHFISFSPTSSFTSVPSLASSAKRNFSSINLSCPDVTPAAPSSSSSETTALELKELPPRRRLDCGKGVDLGTEDAAWLERKDVPMDYEEPGLE
ncbi:hypothetical protein LENED_009910 [Lentinula edodes]|uniref:Uncharacterized protein n=1 Tax=Lentinula edodes TaxID=5353 RepID=A0A1Q3EL13_LENED|nr:hypothetical protein LENED_009910 [Lentinula edodes]